MTKTKNSCLSCSNSSAGAGCERDNHTRCARRLRIQLTGIYHASHAPVGHKSSDLPNSRPDDSSARPPPSPSSSPPFLHDHDSCSYCRQGCTARISLAAAEGAGAAIIPVIRPGSRGVVIRPGSRGTHCVVQSLHYSCNVTDI